MEDLTTIRFSDNLKNNTKSAVCDNTSATLSLTKTSTCLEHNKNTNGDTTEKDIITAANITKRNLNTDFFTILLLVYHMVQWIKVTRTHGQSHQEEDEYQYIYKLKQQFPNRLETSSKSVDLEYNFTM